MAITKHNKNFKRNKNSWLGSASLHILTNYFCPLKWALDSIVMNRESHDTKTNAAFKELRESDIWPSNYNQPYYVLVTKLGVEIRPPHYAYFLENTIVNGAPFGILWGAFMWLVYWAFQPMPWWGAILSTLAAIIMYGTLMAFYFQYSHRKNRLTPWDKL